MRSVWCIIILFLKVLISLSLSWNIPDANQKTVQNGLLNFGTKLNSILLENNPGNKNILFSPYNIYIALALVHLGSNGTTRDAISNVLNIPVTFSPQSLQEVLQNYSSILQINPKKTVSQIHPNKTRIYTFPDETIVLPLRVTLTAKASDLKLANGIFVQNEYRSKLKKKYVEDVQLYQQSDIFNVDFHRKGEETKDTINQYISNKTEKRIPRLLEDPLPIDSVMVFTSCFYFKSVWQEKFNRDQTKTETFRTDKGNVSVQMMHGLFNARYVDIPSLGVEVVKLRFIDESFTMIIGLPVDENQSLKNILRNLTPNQIHTIITKYYRHGYSRHVHVRVDLKLPKTALKWSQSVKNELIKLGLKEEIFESPDLSNMIDQSNIKISDIGHATDIKINEDGTEASAVSIIKKEPLSSCIYRKIFTFHVNRPFFFFIYSHNINAIMFFGTVFDPNST